MKVAEVKALTPHVDVYELSPKSYYLFVVPSDTPKEALEVLMSLPNLNGVIIATDNTSSLRIFAMGN